jgi:uncharacterized protein DUF4189
MRKRDIVGSTGDGASIARDTPSSDRTIPENGELRAPKLGITVAQSLVEGRGLMRRITLFATGLIALTGVFASTAPAFAEYGSIAYDRTNCAWGRSWNYPDQSGADQRAMSECSSQGSSCQVVAQVAPGQCGSVAATDSCSGYGWATRSNTNDAQIVALEQCRNYNPGLTCTIKVSVCSSQ